MEGGLSAGSHVTSITCVAPLQKLSPATSYQARVKVGLLELMCSLNVQEELDEF